ncbi:MAG: hypothetical protein U1E45_07620 [Geminicoccaceae bacterium]
MLRAIGARAAVLFLCLIAGANRAAAQSIDLQPTAAFLAEIYATYDSAKTPANLQGEQWEYQLQHKLWSIFETDRARSSSTKVIQKQYVIDPMTVIFAYNKHFKRINRTLVNNDYLNLIAMLLNDLDVMRSEAERARTYDRQLKDKAKIDVIAKTKSLNDASVLVELDASQAEKPVVTIKDFTDLVDRAAFMYVGGVAVERQNQNKSKKLYTVAQDKKFLLFEAVNRQVINKTDPNRPSQYDTALINGKLQDGKIPVLLGTSRISVANSDDYEDKKARDSNGSL